MFRCPRLGRRTRLLCGLALAPPLLWAALVAVLPTEWARCRLEARLAEAARQPVHVGAVRLCVLGGAKVVGLRVGDTEAEGGAWLVADEVRVDLSLAQMILGGSRPTEVNVTNPAVRLRRLADGTLDLGGLPAPEAPGATPRGRSGPRERGPDYVRVRVAGGRVRLLDDASGTDVELTDVEGKGGWDGREGTVEWLNARLNGGQVQLVARLDRDALGSEFEGQVRATDVGLDGRLRPLGMVAPFLAGAEGGLEGRMDLSVYARGRGRTLAAVLDGLAGYGSVRVDPIRLDRARLLNELVSVGQHREVEDLVRVGSLRSDFQIGARRVATENLTLSLAGLPLVLSGWTGFDGRLEYRLRPDGLVARLPREAREVLAEMPELARELGDVRVEGTLGQAFVTLDGVPLSEAGGAPGGRRSGEDRLRRIGRKLRDQILR